LYIVAKQYKILTSAGHCYKEITNYYQHSDRSCIPTTWALL